MIFLKIEDVLEAFESIDLMNDIFDVESVNREFLKSIENFNKTIRDNPYRMLGLQNLVDSINFFIEKNYCLNLPPKWNISDEEGKWGSIKDYLLNNNGIHIEIYPEHIIEENILGHKFYKSNFSSKDFAKCLANKCIYQQNVEFLTKHENLEIYNDKIEKFLIIKNKIDAIKKKNQIFKNVSWGEMDEKMLHDILNTNNTELIILFTNNNIPKKSLLGNFGHNKMLKSMDVFYEKENDLNKEKIIDFWNDYGEEILLEELIKDPDTKEMILGFVEKSFKAKLSNINMLQTKNIEICKEVFKQISINNDFDQLIEDMDSRDEKNILSFINKNNLIDVIDKKEELLKELMIIYEKEKFNIEMFEKLMTWGCLVHNWSMEESNDVLKLIPSIFFNQEEVAKEEVVKFLQPAYELSLKIKNKQDIIPYWLAIYYEAVQVIVQDKGLNDKVIISSLLKIEQKTFDLIGSFNVKIDETIELSDIDMTTINQELREIALLETIENSDVKKNNRNKRKL